ncbi:hypothetical protein YC2023_078849 [Brassica napus]
MNHCHEKPSVSIPHHGESMPSPRFFLPFLHQVTRVQEEPSLNPINLNNIKASNSQRKGEKDNRETTKRQKRQNHQQVALQLISSMRYHYAAIFSLWRWRQFYGEDDDEGYGEGDVIKPKEDKSASS